VIQPELELTLPSGVMFFPKSLIGAILASAYLLSASWVALDDFKNSSGFIDLRGLATILVTFPVSFFVSWLRKVSGIDPGGFTGPLRSDLTTVLMFSLFIILCTLPVYLFGAGVEALIRKSLIKPR
jgi:hypothetical protein